MQSGGFLTILVFRCIRTGGGRFASQRTEGGEPFLTRAGKNGRQVPPVSSRKLQEEAAWSWR